MYKVQNLEHLKWDTNPTNTSGTGGTYLKAISDEGTNRSYYKMSNYDTFSNKVVGYESIYEVIAYRLCKMLGFESLPYRVIKARICPRPGIKLTTFICESKEFKKKGERKMSLDKYYRLNKIGKEKPDEFMRRMGWGTYVDRMLLLDFLIYNRDRHGANIEVLELKGKIRIAPYFDMGVSFLTPQGNNVEAIKMFNPRSDMPVNCFIGGKSLLDNLGIIRKPIVVNRLTEDSRRGLFYNLSECLPHIIQDKVWNMVKERYIYARDKKVLIERCR